MYKILLISPPIFDFYFTPARREPLGLLYIKAALENKNNIIADIYDTTLSRKIKDVPAPEVFNYLKNIYQEDRSYFSLFSKYHRFGDSFKKIIEKINKGKYNLVGISALFSGYYPDVENLIEKIKDETDTLVAVGGWAVNAEKKILFQKSRADFFLCGNGEDTFPLLIDAIMNKYPYEKIPGLIFRKNNEIISIPEIKPSEISDNYPKRYDAYFFNKKRLASVILSRGCFFTCKFCTIHQNQSFSIRSIQSIDEELHYLLNKGVEIVNFEDDNLFYRKEFTEQLIPLLKKYHDKGLSYTAMNGITAINILPYIDDIIQAGFIEFNFSLVTSDKKIADNFCRPFDSTTLEKIIEIIEGRIKTLVYLIIGLPGSNPSIVLHDILLLAKLPVLIGVSPLYLLPDVPMFKNMTIPTDKRLLRGSALYQFGENFTREDIASIWKFVRMINKIKTSGTTLNHEDEENIFYFKKSLHEKNWYRKKRDGTWERGFSFSMEFPDKFEICKLNNKMATDSFLIRVFNS